MTKNTKYDLEERTAKFGEEVIVLCRKISINLITRSIIDQLIRSATSIGANYVEANGASSKKDFKNKIHICLKEAKETKHWLRMLLVTGTNSHDGIKVLSDECQELILIFRKISQTLREKP